MDMNIHDPLHDLQAAAGAEFLTYGPADGSWLAQIVASFGPYEAEYAAIRKGVGIFAQPRIGALMIRGIDRLDFLQRMLTNDVKALTPGQGRRAFLLDRKGRITADMIVLERDDYTLLVMDASDASATAAELDRYLFGEDVQIEDLSAAYYVLALHGPQAPDLLRQTSAWNATSELQVHDNRSIEIASVSTLLYRHDLAGTTGFHLLISRDQVRQVYEQLTHAVGGMLPTVEGGTKRAIAGRAIGWGALNTARIETGTAIHHVDFGPDTLPHETGAKTLAQAVSFTKGCYLGQEIVARMQSLGHPKRVLATLKLTEAQSPDTGAGIWNESEAGQCVGAITSAAIAPMLGNMGAALAMMKWGHHIPSTKLWVNVSEKRLPAEVIHYE